MQKRAYGKAGDLVFKANPIEVFVARIAEVITRENQTLELRFEDGSLWSPEPYMLSRLERFTPAPGDYVLTQYDGPKYMLPKDEFERNYEPVMEDKRRK